MRHAFWCALLGLAFGIGMQASNARPDAVRGMAGDSTMPAGERSRTEPADTLRVSVVQMRSSRSLTDNLRKMSLFLAQCARDGARVVVFPECSVTGYHDEATMKRFTGEQLADAERRIARSCRENRVYAVIGTPCREAGKLYNSAVVMDPTGKVVERYHKIHLAESWPDAGDHLSVFRIDGIPCSLIICHDERYPELVRLPVLAGARMIFYISHESGIREESKIGPYRAQIQARAVENTVFVLQANAPANPDASGSNGHSRIIAPDGNILQEATIFGEDVLSATLAIEKATGAMARRSLQSGLLGDWWREGVKRVRIIE